MISLLTIILSTATGRPVGAADDPTLIAPGSAGPGPVGAQTRPRTDGATVVWRDGILVQLRVARLADRQPFMVAPAAGVGLYDVDGDVVAWAAQRDPAAPGTMASLVQAKDLATGREVTVADLGNLGVAAGPAVSRGRVAWAEHTAAGSPRILWRDLAAPAPSVVLARVERLWDVRWLTLDGERLAWAEETGGGHWRIRATTLDAPAPAVVAEGQAASSPAIDGLDVAGDFMVYAVHGEHPIILADLRNGGRRPLEVDGAVPTTDGRYVFSATGTIQGYDLATDSRFIATGGMGDAAPDTRGGVLVWQRGPVHASSVHAARVADLLPSARRPAPAEAGPDRAYFPETGHALTSGFKGFWERSGGLPVFGYPLTEEFEQRNADAGRFFTVQYVERQRFEYHPELAGTPYEISLGRLGAEDAARRDLADSWAFQPVAATADHPAGCRYLPEARHRLCGEFRPYWEGHGLELGDPGVSVREALALFGYPLSEEFIDPDTGLITQYFERAVFEYHPDLPADQRVLLRRLGAEQIARSGW
jgi:hypothetical protein